MSCGMPGRSGCMRRMDRWGYQISNGMIIRWQKWRASRGIAEVVQQGPPGYLRQPYRTCALRDGQVLCETADHNSTNQKMLSWRPLSKPRMRVLVVEPEPALARMIARFIDRIGGRAVICDNGQDSVDLLRSGEVFDVVLMDIRPPDQGDGGLFGALMHERPDLVERVVLTSGDTSSPDVRDLVAQAGCPVLAKPYELLELQAALEAAAG
jgi:CheY-like chemotaxis protein